MKVLYVTTECKPFSQVGGIGDIAGELPPALQAEGVEMEIVMPLYGKIKPEFWQCTSEEYTVDFHHHWETVQVCRGECKGVPVWFLRNQTFFEGAYSDPYIYSSTIPFLDDTLRFSFFAKACLPWIRSRKPDIIHANDWTAGYLFGEMVADNLSPRRVLTIHNIGYQGTIWKKAIQGQPVEMFAEQFGNFYADPVHADCYNALRLGLELCNRANTVSPNYCEEITRPADPERLFAGGQGLHELTQRMHAEGRLMGILNGMEYPGESSKEAFQQTLQKKATMKQALSAGFENPDYMLMGFIGRAVEQKFRLLAECVDGKCALEHILDLPGLNLVILTSDLQACEGPVRNTIIPTAALSTSRSNFSCFRGFDVEKAQQILLGSDILLMPSLFEPGSISLLQALSNATPPLVRWTGVFSDVVRTGGNGFGFDGRDQDDLLRQLIQTVKEALKIFTYDHPAFERLQRHGFYKRFEWKTAARKYLKELYLPVMNHSLHGR